MRVLGQSVQARYQQLFGEKTELPDGGYEGEYIQDIAKQLADEYGESLLQEAGEEVFRQKAERAIFEEIGRTLERMNIKDRKSTRLNSSHVAISYAVFCLKKKTQLSGA